MTKEEKARRLAGIVSGMMTAEEVAAFLNIPPLSLRTWIKKGNLVPYKFNQRVIRFKRSDVEKFMAGLR
jgi:excisionase family DNA binding protein